MVKDMSRSFCFDFSFDPKKIYQATPDFSSTDQDA